MHATRQPHPALTQSMLDRSLSVVFRDAARLSGASARIATRPIEKGVAIVLASLGVALIRQEEGVGHRFIIGAIGPIDDARFMSGILARAVYDSEERNQAFRPDEQQLLRHLVRQANTLVQSVGLRA